MKETAAETEDARRDEQVDARGERLDELALFGIFCYK